MLSFVNDYSEGACPEILQRLAETNLDHNPGYGSDDICASASRRIREAFSCPEAEVFYLVGGTQTNTVVIDSLLSKCEGVVSAATGHIGVHEAGAVEASGHKVLTVPSHSGKMTAADLRAYLAGFYADGNHEHMVFPGMAYISHPTEYGTLYSKAELEALHAVCAEYNIPLYMDGARLGYALACPENDLAPADIARLTDVFYIGGTKCGALFGEAVVFPRGNMPRRFVTLAKQHGALLAKGWLLGLQFDVLFTDGLYERVCKNAIDIADMLREALRGKGYRFFMENPTNQLLVVLENSRMRALSEQCAFSFWEAVDDTHTAVRFCTSWASRPEEIKALIRVL